MANSADTAGFSAFRDTIQSPALRAVADHWNEMRGRRRTPSWTHLKLSAIAPHLGAVWAFDHDRDAGTFTGRLAGSNIMIGFGRSFAGMPLGELHSPQVYEFVRAYFLRVVSEPACCRWSGKIFRVDDGVFEGERIVLPMGGDGAEGVLGATWYDYPVWRAPGRLELIHDIANWCKI